MVSGKLGYRHISYLEFRRRFISYDSRIAIFSAFGYKEAAFEADREKVDSLRSYKIEELLSGVDGIAPAQWERSVSIVKNQRREVERLLEKGETIYGFSTFLGHLDKYEVDLNVQNLVLEAHLVGNPRPVSVRKMRGISVMKICQLSHGESGISEYSYASLIESFENICEGNIDLAASYGSGDVVPATWWVKSVLGLDRSFLNGDVIALINGQFVAAGIALAEFSEIRRQVTSALDQLGRVAVLAKNGEVQSSVALRDVGPIRRLAENCLKKLAEELERSANTPSGNPLFRPTGKRDEIEAFSNSTFLNFELANAVRQVGEMLSVLSAYLRAATLWICSNLESRQGELIHGAYFVQPPKVSKAYSDRVMTLAAQPAASSQSESKYVEDIGDSCLLRTSAVEEMIPLVASQISILSQAEKAVQEVPGFRWRFGEE